MADANSQNESYRTCDKHGLVYDSDTVDECPMCLQLEELRGARGGQ